MPRNEIRAAINTGTRMAQRLLDAATRNAFHAEKVGDNDTATAWVVTANAAQHILNTLDRAREDRLKKALMAARTRDHQGVPEKPCGENGPHVELRNA